MVKLFHLGVKHWSHDCTSGFFCRMRVNRKTSHIHDLTFPVPVCMCARLLAYSYVNAHLKSTWKKTFFVHFVASCI